MTMLDIFAPPARVVAADRQRTGPIVLYGNRWCGLTQLVARTLARAGLHYDYVDLDEHPSIERRLRTLSGGRLRTPVLYVDGQWLVAPSTSQLHRALTRAGVAAA